MVEGSRILRCVCTVLTRRLCISAFSMRSAVLQCHAGRHAAASSNETYLLVFALMLVFVLLLFLFGFLMAPFLTCNVWRCVSSSPAARTCLTQFAAAWAPYCCHCRMCSCLGICCDACHVPYRPWTPYTTAVIKFLCTCGNGAEHRTLKCLRMK